MKLSAWILTGVSCSLMCAGSAQAAWVDWWQTPEQQAARAFDNADHETLLNNAPDAGWTGLGQYQAGDYEAAAQSFAEQASEQLSDDDLEAANRMRYNQGVSEVRAGRYDAAIDQFDAVLESDPAFEDAAHNLEVAQQLKALVEQQDQQERQDGEQQEGQPGEADDQEGQPGEQEAQQEGQQTEQENQQAEQQNADQQAGNQQAEPQPGDESGDASSDSSQLGQSESEEQKAAEEARKALEAEARQQSGTDPDSQEEGTETGLEAVERPLSEGEQATEQLLRRIPDDPAGLLRRKLEQSHRSEYPEVRDALEPW